MTTRKRPTKLSAEIKKLEAEIARMRASGGGAAFLGAMGRRRNPDEARSLSEIARDIRRSWEKPYFGAVPYIREMGLFTSIDDGGPYGDGARDIVLRFLSNAATWRGDDARRIKAELNGLLKGPKPGPKTGLRRVPNSSPRFDSGEPRRPLQPLQPGQPLQPLQPFKREPLQPLQPLRRVSNPSWEARVFEPANGKNKGKTFMFFPKKEVCCGETSKRLTAAGLIPSSHPKHATGRLWVQPKKK